MSRHSRCWKINWVSGRICRSTSLTAKDSSRRPSGSSFSYLHQGSRQVWSKRVGVNVEWCMLTRCILVWVHQIIKALGPSMSIPNKSPSFLSSVKIGQRKLHMRTCVVLWGLGGYTLAHRQSVSASQAATWFDHLIMIHVTTEQYGQYFGQYKGDCSLSLSQLRGQSCTMRKGQVYMWPTSDGDVLSP